MAELLQEDDLIITNAAESSNSDVMIIDQKVPGKRKPSAKPFSNHKDGMICSNAPPQ
jgi:hypothetical protein